MGAPQVPIEVDDRTGVWSTDGLPMLYVPRHFFVNNHLAIEAALGVETYATQLYDAGLQSAYTWCEHEAAVHGLSGPDVFHHYMRRLSQRGWGQFSVQTLDAASGRARVRVDHSAFALHLKGEVDRKVCYMFAGWFPGALTWVGRALGHTYRLTAQEIHCQAEGRVACLFEVTPEA